MHRCTFENVTQITDENQRSGVMILPGSGLHVPEQCDYPELHTQEFTDALLTALIRSVKINQP